MKLYFDENFFYRLSNALKELEQGAHDGVEVHHLTEEFPRGTSDGDWIPVIAQKNGIVITQDLNIHKTRSLNLICEKHRLSLVLFKPPKKRSYTYWDWVEVVVAKWRTVKDEIKTHRGRFVLEIADRSVHVLS
jgi:predicted nuclease of predicted toxin-antitoxin system